jgi:hypothetical protein
MQIYVLASQSHCVDPGQSTNLFAKGSGRNSNLPANGAQQHAHPVLTAAFSCSLLKTNTPESVESRTNRPLLIINKNPAEISTEQMVATTK